MSEFDFDVDLDEVDTDKLGGFNSPVPGHYCGQITQIGYGMPKWDACFWFDAEVLSGVPDNQTGKVQRLGFDDPRRVADNRRGVCFSKLLTFAIAIGLTTDEEVKAKKAAKQKLSFDWDLAVGRLLCFVVDANDKTRCGTSVKDFGYFATTSPKAAGIPMPAAGNGNGNGNGQSAAPAAAVGGVVNDAELDAMIG